MVEYWNKDGNSYDFKELEAMVHRQHLNKSNESGKDDSSPFSMSSPFPYRERKIWKKLTKPHLKPDRKELKSMIDDSNVEDELKPMPMLNEEEEDPEERMIANLRRMNDQRGNNSSSSDESRSSSDEESNVYEDDSEDDSESEESDSSEEGDSEYELSEEEQDEWMKKRKMKPTAARQKEHYRRQRNALQRAINRAIGLLKKNDPQVCIIVCPLIYLELFLPHIKLLPGYVSESNNNTGI